MPKLHYYLPTVFAIIMIVVSFFQEPTGATRSFAVAFLMLLLRDIVTIFDLNGEE